METFGVHSEVGKLRTVLVCRPGLAHQRLTPGNAEELLFDDVLWVQEAQKRPLRLRAARCASAASRCSSCTTAGGDAAGPEARGWVLDGASRSTTSAWASPHPAAWLDEMPAGKLAEHLIGGIAMLDVRRASGTR
jgi:arginine deiminase